MARPFKLNDRQKEALSHLDTRRFLSASDLKWLMGGRESLHEIDSFYQKDGSSRDEGLRRRPCHH